MPIYCYECTHCKYEFEEFHNQHEKSGKTICIKCGNKAFKIPALFNTNIFKPRKFSDGTETPPFVSTPKQEKNWLKSTGVTYDAPSSDAKLKAKQERDFKSKTSMEIAFSTANEKFNQGLRVEYKKQREVKGNAKFERNSG